MRRSMSARSITSRRRARGSANLSMPLVLGALRAGRPVPPQPADDVPPDQRKPVPGAYGAEVLTKKGVFGVVAGHQNRTW
jgi:hypothetical protein